MTTFTRKPTAVEAWRYDRQPKTDWPQWLQDFQVTTNMGLQPIGAGPGVLLIPSKSGATANVPAGDWIVLENGVITAYKDAAFRAAFDGDFDTPAAAQAAAEVTTGPEEADASVEAAAAPAAEAPAETTPAPTTGRGRQKAGGTETPAEDAPAAEADA